MGMIDSIIIHCSDSKWGDVNVIRDWHTERGWSDIGYHFVIMNGQIRPGYYLKSLDGQIEIGRRINGDGVLIGPEIGAHALGYNSRSIGICIIGVDNFTYEQFDSLYNITNELITNHDIDISNVMGHYETPKANGKTCPNYDMAVFRDILDVGWYDRDTIPINFQNKKII